jgi:hypothetical protein
LTVVVVAPLSPLPFPCHSTHSLPTSASSSTPRSCSHSSSLLEKRRPSPSLSLRYTSDSYSNPNAYTQLARILPFVLLN